MKINTGMGRKVDVLGRIVIPKEIRKAWCIDVTDVLSISLDGENIILNKVQNSCIFCDSTENLREFGGKLVCDKCFSEITKWKEMQNV